MVKESKEKHVINRYSIDTKKHLINSAPIGDHKTTLKAKNKKLEENFLM